MEIWKPIKGYEDRYEVSSKGRVRSIDQVIKRNSKCTKPYYKKLGETYVKKGKILKNCISTNGYYIVVLSKNGKTKTRSVHTLVADAFLSNKRRGYVAVVDHIDSDKLNNCVENLQIVSQRRNTEKSKRRGVSSKYIGVSYFKRTNKWKAGIIYQKKQIHLGYYHDEEEAHQAVLKFKKEKGLR